MRERVAMSDGASPPHLGFGSHRRWARSTVPMGALAIVVFVVAGCGGGGGGSAAPQVAHIAKTSSTTVAASATKGASTAGPANAEFQKYANYTNCMRSHGVPNFPQPTLSANGVDYGFHIGLSSGINPASPQFKSAVTACRALLPRVTSPKITPAQQADYLKAAACMRAHGIVGFPDPTFTSSVPGGVTFELPQGMDPNSTPFRKARVICEKLIPAGLPFSS